MDVTPYFVKFMTCRSTENIARRVSAGKILNQLFPKIKLRKLTEYSLCQIP